MHGVLVQDMASHGLAAAYSAGSTATKEQLVKALVEKLQMAGPALLAAKEDAAQEDAAKARPHPLLSCTARADCLHALHVSIPCTALEGTMTRCMLEHVCFGTHPRS